MGRGLGSGLESEAVLWAVLDISLFIILEAYVGRIKLPVFQHSVSIFPSS